MPKFWGVHDIKLTPNIARVTYQIKEDPLVSGSYQLQRQETSDIASDKTTESKARPYTMVDGIRELSIKFLAKFEEEEEPKKEEQAAPGPQPGQKPPQPTAQKKKKITYKEVDEWNTDTLAKDQKAQEKEKKKGAVQKLIPVRVMMQGSFWDNAKKRSFPFHFNVAISTDSAFKPRPKPSPLLLASPPGQTQGRPPSQTAQRNSTLPQSTLSGTINFLNKMLGPLPPAPARNPMAGNGMQVPQQPGIQPGTYTPLQGRS